MFERVSNVGMKRTNRTEVPAKVELVHEEKAQKERYGAEHQVLQASLDYGGGRVVEGLVYKKLWEEKILGKENKLDALLEDVLDQWEHIRAVKRELTKRGEEGFNIPGTIRKIRTEDSSGILVSDLSEGGKNELIDVKILNSYPEEISRSEWRKIKEAVLRDLEIATKNNIRIVGGNTGLDAWLLVRDKKTKEFKVYLSDISAETSKTFSTPYYGENDLTYLRRSAESYLDTIERDLESKWAKIEKNSSVWPWGKKSSE